MFRYGSGADDPLDLNLHHIQPMPSSNEGSELLVVWMASLEILGVRTTSPDWIATPLSLLATHRPLKGSKHWAYLEVVAYGTFKICQGIALRG